MYAVPASKCDGSILDTTPQTGSPVMFFVTSFQFLPASRVYQTLPSLVPAQMRPFWTSEGAIEKTTSPKNCPRLSPTMPPEEITRLGSLVERSGENSLQLTPPFVVRRIIWQP